MELHYICKQANTAYQVRSTTNGIWYYCRQDPRRLALAKSTSAAVKTKATKSSSNRRVHYILTDVNPAGKPDPSPDQQWTNMCTSTYACEVGALFTRTALVPFWGQFDSK